MKVIECDEDEEGNAIRAELGKRTGRTSMPSIWVRGEGYAQTPIPKPQTLTGAAVIGAHNRNLSRTDWKLMIITSYETVLLLQNLPHR